MNKCSWSKGILYFTLYNNDNGVIGIAYVSNTFNAYLHRHQESETYVFLEGKGRLYLNNTENYITSPSIISIPSNMKHAMTPITNHVKLMFIFNTGPLEKIQYTYYNNFIPSKL